MFISYFIGVDIVGKKKSEVGWTEKKLKVGMAV